MGQYAIDFLAGQFARPADAAFAWSSNFIWTAWLAASRRWPAAPAAAVLRAEALEYERRQGCFLLRVDGWQ